MKKSEILFYAERRGLCVNKIKEGRKVLFKVRIPKFSNREVIPTDFEEVILRNIKEVWKKAEELWEDDEYRRRASAWTRTW